MTDIVKIKNNQATTTNLDIAKGTQYEHRAVLKLIKSHKERLLKFGDLNSALEVRNPAGGRVTTYFILNEAQATLLLTMMKNTPKVLDFKVALVDAFFQARALLQTDTMNLLYKHALLQTIFDNEKEQASSCGRGLAEWKKIKDGLQKAIGEVQLQIQPQLPFES